MNLLLHNCRRLTLPRPQPRHGDGQRGPVAPVVVRLAPPGQRQLGADLQVGGEERGRRPDQRKELLGRRRARLPRPLPAFERPRRVRQPRHERLEEFLRQSPRIVEGPLCEELQLLSKCQFTYILSYGFLPASPSSPYLDDLLGEVHDDPPLALVQHAGVGPPGKVLDEVGRQALRVVGQQEAVHEFIYLKRNYDYL